MADRSEQNVIYAPILSAKDRTVIKSQIGLIELFLRDLENPGITPDEIITYAAHITDAAYRIHQVGAMRMDPNEHLL